ncbi:MAG: Na+ dependent nucleoside transporter [Verrucomicrobia bacterium]|nr:MAG: Na+ dependent nucleoside transporter [Verrucomicrobiota bacterium]
MDITHVFRGLLGIAALLGIAYVFSANRRAIPWRVVFIGLGLQVALCVLILKVSFVRGIFDAMGTFFVKVLSFTAEGSALVFGWLFQVPAGGAGLVINASDGRSFATYAPIFAISVLPSIIFFSALTTLLYRLGVLQVVVKGFAWIMAKTLRLSGPETLNASANVFVGQTEAPLLIKPFLERMSRSELLAVMVGGMATIAGGVMAVYITLLGGDNPAEQVRWASHLLTASVLSAPAALITAKILLPETEEVDRTLALSAERPGANLIDAICIGTSDGVKLAVNVGGMLIVFTALVAMANWLLSMGLGEWTGLNAAIAKATDGQFTGFSLQFIFGMIGAPVAWLIGIDADNLQAGGRLLGEKVVLNEFFAYFTLSGMQASGELVDDRARIILTYALCGFSNIVSIGIQVGGLGAMAPGRRGDIAMLGWRALLGGNIACFFTACIVGMLI